MRTNESPIGDGLCGDRVPNTPVLSPFNRGGATLALIWVLSFLWKWNKILEKKKNQWVVKVLHEYTEHTRISGQIAIILILLTRMRNEIYLMRTDKLYYSYAYLHRYNNISKILIHRLFIKYHICENCSNPSKAWSGFVKILLNRVILPRLSIQIPGCRGVPFFSWNDDETRPMGCKNSELFSSSRFTLSGFAMLFSGIDEEHDSHFQFFNETKIRSTSFW